MTHSQLAFLGRLGCILLVLAVSCTERASYRVREDGLTLFSFFDRSAELRTVDRIALVDPVARANVMVIDPREQLATGEIRVADLRKTGTSGGYRTWVMTEKAWLDLVTPKTSVVPAPTPQVTRGTTTAKTASKQTKTTHPKKRLAQAKRRQQPAERPKPEPAASSAPSAAPLPAVPTQGPQVTVYGTSWCPSCRVARAYFRQRGITFEDLDVEKDPGAAERFIQVQKEHNLRAGAVPVIVVNGRAFQGFSRLRIEAALALGNKG